MVNILLLLLLLLLLLFQSKKCQIVCFSSMYLAHKTKQTQRNVLSDQKHEFVLLFTLCTHAADKAFLFPTAYMSAR